MYVSNDLLSVKTLPVRNSLSRSPLRRAFLAGVLGLAWLALSFPAQALLPPPPPDGGYPGGNTAEGDFALLNLTSGSGNTALGFSALGSNTTGSRNTATGFDALVLNTQGVNNTATGYEALFSNRTGFNNTATGLEALFSNTTGNNNTANGLNALFNNITGNNNTATGFQALENNTTAVGNTASGFQALLSNRTGLNNTADSRQALQSNTSGSFNIGLGNLAGRNLTTGSNNIDIGNQGVAAEARTIRIGEQGNQLATFIAGIRGATIANGVQVMVAPNGKLGTIVSSARFKEAIKPMNTASEAILQLEPVTFRYKHELDPDGIPQFGLIAEQVEKVNPDLVVRDKEGKPYSVRYEAVNAMLLNEFLKEHRKVQQFEQRAREQELRAERQEAVSARREKDFYSRIARQEKEIETLNAMLKEQTSAIHKVIAQLELSKPAQLTAVNHQ